MILYEDICFSVPADTKECVTLCLFSILGVGRLLAADYLLAGCVVYKLSHCLPMSEMSGFPLPLHTLHLISLVSLHPSIAIWVVFLLFDISLTNLCCLCSPSFGSLPACVPFLPCLMSLWPPTVVFLKHLSGKVPSRTCRSCSKHDDSLGGDGRVD